MCGCSACTPLSAADWYCRPTTGADIARTVRREIAGVVCSVQQSAPKYASMRTALPSASKGNAQMPRQGERTLGGCSPGNGQLEALCGHRECLGGMCPDREWQIAAKSA